MGAPYFYSTAGQMPLAVGTKSHGIYKFTCIDIPVSGYAER